MLLTAACGSSGKPSVLQSYLTKQYGLQLSALPPHPTTLSAHQAEVLVSGASMSKGHKVTAVGLWRVTDPELFIPEHGIRRLLIHNQVAWMVLVHGVDITGAPTPSGATGANSAPPPQPKPVFGNEAVLVNAENGRLQGFWPLPARIH